MKLRELGKDAIFRIPGGDGYPNVYFRMVGKMTFPGSNEEAWAVLVLRDGALDQWKAKDGEVEVELVGTEELKRLSDANNKGQS